MNLLGILPSVNTSSGLVRGAQHHLCHRLRHQLEEKLNSLLTVALIATSSLHKIQLWNHK